VKKFLIIAFLFQSIFSFGQITDNFSDGDFTNNPSWNGDAGQFIVNASQQLQLNSSGTSSSYLAVATSLPTLDNTEWQFYIKLNFAPSASNNARVYLVSNSQNLKGSLNGYYLQFGENLSNDAIELFKQTGTTTVSVARGTDGFLASAFTIRVKVTRDNNGLWSIFADAAAGTNFSLQATGTDVTYNSGNYFGVVCNYTSSNATNFFFDDFVIPNIADVIAPTIINTVAASSTQADVHFSEPISQLSAQTATNYSVNNGLGNPSTATRDASDFSVVHLVFSTPFNSGTANTITINNVEDLAGNPIASNSTSNFTYQAPVIAQPFDIVINEIYFEPVSSAPLPNAEFVELFNRSSAIINLNGWKISDGSTSVAVIGNVSIQPGDYLIVCKSSDAPLFSAYGNVAGTPSFPSLNNDIGDDLKLFDNNSQQIDRVVFSDDYYNNSTKKNGGFTIERINPDFTCDVRYNWLASNDPSGGTPGKINSVKGNYTDTTSPELLRAYLASSTQIDLTFSKTPDAAVAALASSYSIDNGIGQPLTVNINDRIVSLILSSPLQNGIIYHVTVSDDITDCPGNKITGTLSLKVALPEAVTSGGILINEILFNPKTGGNDFVELYNNSTKVFDLKNLRICNTDNLDSIATNYVISSDGYLFFPGDYVALTSDVASLMTFYPSAVKENILQSSLPSYNDDKGTCIITDYSFNRLDRFAYTASMHYPLIDDVNGVSLERISFTRPTQDIGNWHSAAAKVGYATPGYKNSQSASEQIPNGELSIQPEIFSPDDDGYNDVITFYLNLNENGYMLNAKIYNDAGQLVKNLVKSKLLAPNDSFTWDGINERNEKAATGIYVLYAEVFNPTGSTKKFKKAFVVATKL
jgi:hypothetical protein